ncbi:PH (Pleckstrin Homology) domain-containing protein [Geodermatophilus tzadiensis]|uniref:PH (Pleckstrin Homology) domain-containing protein n=1 Tax=Geodermatophilus tzadiensis TaxID=1137988 RepID=A0A2T0U1L5_9ACTN|nr:PH domain-containing protein [Geodermatophilus tzadiensis]PRY51820.1 PH (Pleckstrin Homology) domain-containing protein [Geodermatophilus tzadiensis]
MTGPARRTDGRPPRWAKDAAKYLLPGERAVVATRRHWAVLLEPAAKALPVALLGLWVLTLEPDDEAGATVGLVLVLGALGWFALRAGEWWMRHFIVTRRRVLLTSGIVARTVTLLPLRRITDLTWKETLLGQVLGYGTFRFESAGQQQALSQITFLPRADLLYHQVSGLLFGSDWGGAAGGDDEGNPEPAEERGGRRDTEPIPGVRTPPEDGPGQA